VHEDHNTFFILSRSVLLRMRNVSDESSRENRNTHFMFDTFFLNRAVYERMWKHFAEPGRPQMKFGACALHAGYLWLQTHSEYVILFAFPPQQRFTNAPKCYYIRKLSVFLGSCNSGQALDQRR
jgi:hypothetical protein